MGDTYTMDPTGIIRQVVERVGALTDDEAALVRTLSPADQPETAKVDHLLDLVEMLTTIRADEAMAAADRAVTFPAGLSPAPSP